MDSRWTIELPDSALYESATYVVDVSGLPEPIRGMLDGATFLGRGASSAAWRLPDDTVLKLTTDKAAWSFNQWQQANEKPHLPKILSSGSVGVTLAAFQEKAPRDWEQWYFVVQPLYEPVDPQVWKSLNDTAQPVGASQCKSRPGWGKTKNGLMAHGQLAQDHLAQLEKVFAKEPTLTQAALAVSMLAQWWMHAKGKAGLDVDKSDNWAKDPKSGDLVLLDPVYGNDKSTSGYHWSVEV
jgi:hypothetical protein